MRSVGLTSNPLLLWGLLGELIFTAVLVYWPPAQHVFGTAALPAWVLVLLLPFPVLVWGLDELVRASRRRRRDAARETPSPADKRQAEDFPRQLRS